MAFTLHDGNAWFDRVRRVAAASNSGIGDNEDAMSVDLPRGRSMTLSWNRVFRAALIVFGGWALSFLLLTWNYYQQPAGALRPTDIELHTRLVRPGADLVVAGVLILVVLARVFALSQRFSPVSEVIGCGIALEAALGTFYYSLGPAPWLPRPGEGLNWFLENVLAYLLVVSLLLATLWLATRRQERARLEDPHPR